MGSEPCYEAWENTVGVDTYRLSLIHISPKEIFSQVDTLKKYRLDVPQVTLLAHELRKSGVSIPEGILTKEELVSALCQ